MKILITGGTGSIGSKVIKELKKKHIIFSTFRQNNRPDNHEIKWIKFQNLRKKKFEVDIIINCIVTHENSKKNKLIDYINSNIKSMDDITNYSKKNKIKLIVNLSTISVYKKNAKTINEDCEIDNSNFLSLTKSLGELILKNSNLNYINLRLPSVIDFNGNNYNWINRCYNNLKFNKKVDLKNPNNKINEIIDIEEILNFIEYILDKKLYKFKETINFVPKDKIEIRKIVDMMRNNLKSKSRIKYFKTNDKEKYYSSKKIINLFNYKVTNIDKIILRNLR